MSILAEPDTFSVGVADTDHDTTAAAVSIRGLVKQFPNFRLGPLDLTVPRGAIYGFVGPNGSGKSTTIDLIFGMGRADAGSITVAGMDHVREEREMKLRAAYVSPELGFRPWGTVARALAFVAGFYPDWDAHRCSDLLRAFGLNSAEKVAALSFGQRMKLALITALSRDAEVLILDEPTTGLDAVARRTLHTELLRIVSGGRRSVLISSHSLAELERLADHVGFLDRGRLVLEGPMDEIVGRHRQVDFLWKASAAPVIAGLTVQSLAEGRCRAVVDAATDAREQLRLLGAELISDSPVTLEELFLALVKTESN